MLIAPDVSHRGRHRPARIVPYPSAVSFEEGDRPRRPKCIRKVQRRVHWRDQVRTPAHNQIFRSISYPISYLAISPAQLADAGIPWVVLGQ